MWGFPKIRGTILGVPIIRTMTIAFWGLFWGPPILGSPYFGKLPMSAQGQLRVLRGIKRDGLSCSTP